MAYIETINLGQRRERRDILKNVNLAVEKGEVHALIGPTGAGKTTLLRLIDTLDKPNTGKILINGMDIFSSEKTKLETRRSMAFVLQKPVVFNISVYDNVAYGLKWRGLNRTQVREKVNEILETVEIVEYRRRNARTLSGGEMQRVAIARAMANDPKILLADEPTGNLDTVTGEQILKILVQLNEQGKTIIMVTHESHVAAHAKQKLHMLDGIIERMEGDE